MANPEHLVLLKEGVAIWNEWRSKHPMGLPDFSEADLSGAPLIGANLLGANLNGTNLKSAYLGVANLSLARMTRANLAGARLLWATFNKTLLHQADFTAAEIGSTTFAEVDLSCVIGLESVKHLSPSTIGIDTIYRSQGEIPHAFLRGAGIPNHFVQYMTSLVGDGIEFYSLFISYSTKDQEFADQLYADLQTRNIRCWFAPHSVQGGKKLHEQISEAIRMHDKLLLILSPASMASEWVQTEIAKARKRELEEHRRVLFPIRLCSFEELRDWECFDADTGKDSAREIREYFIPDFSHWKDLDSYRKAFARLLNDLQGNSKSSED